MGKFETKYNSIWESTYEWLEEVKEDVFSAKCKICKCNFKINGSGIGQIKIHSASKKHTKAVTIINGHSNQLTLCTTENNTLQMSTGI